VAVSASQCCPGRLGTLEVECRVGAEAGARGGKSLRRRFGFLSQVVGSGGVADCVLSRREGRVSCPIGAVGWCSKRVRALEAAGQDSNSHRLGWRDGPATRLVVRCAAVVGRGVEVCRSGLVSGAALQGFGVSCFVAGAVRGGGAGWGLGHGSNTALKLTWLSGGGKQEISRIR
jgi:hypothetical protein